MREGNSTKAHLRKSSFGMSSVVRRGNDGEDGLSSFWAFIMEKSGRGHRETAGEA